MSASDLEPGARIDDRYLVVRTLGAGGMGTVYLARDERAGREVALKVLRSPHNAADRSARRLRREARAASSLDPARVATIYEVGETAEGLVYLAMEYVRGETLRARLNRQVFEVDEALRVVREVATALGAAHARGLIHRDVKPDNVMLAADGRVVLLDFGIAKELEPTGDPGNASTQITVEGTMLGTPAYVAPEQAIGSEAGPAADQFALAVTAFELLTGKLPWTATEGARLLAQVLGARPSAAGSIDPRLRRFDFVLDRGMEKEPARRFSSVVAFVLALEAAGRGEREAGEESTRSPASTTVEEDGASSSGRSYPASPPERAKLASLSLRPPSRWFALGLAALGLVTAASWLYPRAHRAGATSGGASRAPACTSNAACVRAHGGSAWRCDTATLTCVEIASVDCKPSAEPGDLEREDTIWIGGMFPLSTEPDWDDEMRGAELARRDFAAALGSSALRKGDLHAPPIALVVCDEGADPARAARHLATDVRVPAVLGFRGSRSALATIPDVLLPAHVLSILSLAQGSGLTAIPEPKAEPRLVWRTTLNNADKAAPLDALLSGFLEPRARRERGGIGDRPLKVAVVHRRAAIYDLTDDFYRRLHVNGRSALENGKNFRQFAFGDASDASTASRSEEVAELARFGPQVVLVEMQDGFVPDVLIPLEAAWGAGPRPSYVVGSELERPMLDFIGTNASRRRRFFSTNNVSTSSTNASLVFHYNRAFPDTPVTLTTAPQPSYDAFYLLADAIYATGEGDVSGPSLSRGIERLLPPGRKIEVGPAGIFDAFETLRSGGRIDLEGAIGSLDFDVATGEAPISYSILCCGVDAQGRASGSIESGLVFDGATGTLKGALACP